MDKIIVLGAGKVQRIEGADHQDILKLEGINRVFDLNVPRWPLEENCYSLVVASHVVEHLDNLINFMNNCHRILKPGGKVYIETPNAGANPDLTHCDPTHVRCYRPYTFYNYFTEYGINNFGYTHLPWAIVNVRTIQYEKPDDVIIAELTPLK